MLARNPPPGLISSLLIELSFFLTDCCVSETGGWNVPLVSFVIDRFTNEDFQGVLDTAGSSDGIWARLQRHGRWGIFRQLLTCTSVITWFYVRWRWALEILVGILSGFSFAYLEVERE